MNSSMLVLAVAGLGFPTLFAALHDSDSADVLSLWTGAALLLCYGAYLVFTFSMPGQQLEDEPGRARWSIREAVFALAVTAVATGIVSELLVDSIKPTVESLGVPRAFVGLILVPFVGHVAEHFSAVRLAYRNRVDFAMGIAFGSGIQIALGASGIAVFSSILLGDGSPGLRPAPDRGPRRSGPRRHTGRPRRRDKLARGPPAARDLPDHQRRRLAPVTG